MFEFLNLIVYKKAKAFHRACRCLILEFQLEKYEKDQLGRASMSIPLNIAEGSGKFSKRDRRNFFVIARASIFECIAILDILQDERPDTKNNVLHLFVEGDELSRILYTMIKNLE